MGDKKKLEQSNTGIQHQLDEFLRLQKDVKPRTEALKIISIYLILGSLWILLTEKALGVVVDDLEIFKTIQLYKGWFYVLITGIVFYFLIDKRMMLFKVAIDRVLQGYEELSTTHEELTAMDKELMQQYDELEKHRNALITSNQRYQLAVEGANDGIWDWDLQTGKYFFSLKSKDTFGYNEDDLDNNLETWQQLFHPNDRQKALETVETYLKDKTGIYENTYRIRGKDGQYRWVLSRGKAVWDRDGNAIRIAGSHTDITEHMKLQEFLRQQKELSKSVIHNAPVIIIVWDQDKRIRDFNTFAEEITGHKKEEVLGKNGIDFLIAENHKKHMNEVFNSIYDEKGFKQQELEIDILCKSGNYVTILWKNSLLHNQKANVQGVVSIGIDITDRRNMEKKLHRLAYFDSLTQLPNRTMFQEEAYRIIGETRQKGKKLAFLYLDIDNFKHINDIMGHKVGDQLILYIANILADFIKPPNILARLIGDEFGIILVDINNNEEVTSQVNEILSYLRRPWMLDKQEFFISVSIGVSIYPQHGRDAGELMQYADTAMSHAKENQKDGFSIYTSDMLEKSLQYIQMSNQLRYAISNEEFALYYQPQIDLFTNKVVGLEALIRWIHPEKGFISPMDFIPFAEETGFIGEIEEWVIKTACQQKKLWKQQGYGDIKISINLSSKLLTQPTRASIIQKILDDHNMECGGIELEITETAVIDHLEKAIQVLCQLKKYNITIALDDFGTGYSSLTYLQKLPIDILKVDREFIRNIENEEEKGYIFKAIIDLAHNLGLKVVAEGIETEMQLDFSKNNHCDIGQGYYFSKPAPAADIEEFLKQIKDFKSQA